jgi:hypothetical protein
MLVTAVLVVILALIYNLYIKLKEEDHALAEDPAWTYTAFLVLALIGVKGGGILADLAWKKYPLTDTD